MPFLGLYTKREVQRIVNQERVAAEKTVMNAKRYMDDANAKKVRKAIHELCNALDYQSAKTSNENATVTFS